MYTSFAEFSKLTSIKDATHQISAEEMIRTLLKDHETVVHHANIIIAKAESAQDQGTMDMLIQRLREHEKTTWMLKSSLGQK